MPQFCTSSYQTSLSKKRAARLTSLTSCFHTVFRALSSASTGRSSHTHTRQTAHENIPCIFASSRAPTRRARTDVVATSKRYCRAARTLPRAAEHQLQGCGARGEAAQLLPRSALRGDLGSSPKRAPLPAPRDASLTGEHGLAAAAQRQP